MKKFILFLFVGILSLAFANPINAQEKFKVVLDAGHGGSDPGNLGAKGHSYLEKDIVLKIVLEIGELLDADRNIEVIYTRKDDTFIELFERGAIAQKSKADLFVSVHCDAFGNSSVNGAGTFVLGLHGNDRNFEVAKKENSVIFMEDDYKKNYDGFDPNSPEAVISLTLMQEEYLDESLLVADLIQKNFVNDLKRKDRLVKQAGFIVLHQTFMPSVLIETGFLTNKKEGAYLNSERGQKEMASAIYKAIKSYIKQFDDNRVVDIKPKPKKKLKKQANKPRIFDGVDFKVQIASGSKKVKTVSYNFKGLKEIERVKIGAHHKYYYGKTSDYTKIKEYQKLAKEKGYIGAFVVAYKNNKKVSVLSILKTE